MRGPHTHFAIALIPDKDGLGFATMSSLLITGASGFIGQALLRKLNLGQFDQVYCLSRGGTNVTASLSATTNIRVLQGNIFDTEVYSPSLKQCDTVMHLAAVTGKASERDYFTVNTDGTKVLLAECQKAGATRFLYVSSIAVKFNDISGYPYARSKMAAEAAVRESGLNYTIVRPTIVLGQDASILKSLSTLGKPPIIPMLGDGQAKIQPIYVDDLVDCLLFIMGQGEFSHETFDLGGPEVVSMEDLVLLIRELQGNSPPLSVIHLPLKPIAGVLRVMEQLGVPTPFSAAQVSSFRNDGRAEANQVHSQHVGAMKTVREMVELALGHS